MTKAKRSLIIIGLLLVFFVLQQAGTLATLVEEFQTMPWWGYFVLAGIVYSGFKYLTINQEEEEIDHQWIEEQGKVYINRMEEEREERRKTKKTGAM